MLISLRYILGVVCVAIVALAAISAKSGTFDPAIAGIEDFEWHRVDEKSPRKILNSESLTLRGPLVLSMTPETAQRDAFACRAWTYRSLSPELHLRSMRQVSLADWGRYCYQYSCSVQGDAEVDGFLYQIEINAGGWISLTSHDGSKWYWASSKKLPGFLAACDCCE